MVPGGNEYIRHIENDGETIIIICFTDQQAEHIKDARFLQVDMTYKRVLGDINELVYACLDQTLNRGMYSQFYSVVSSCHLLQLTYLLPSSAHCCPGVCQLRGTPHLSESLYQNI